jgi:formylmethanofuran dehydrogenase subunit E
MKDSDFLALVENVYAFHTKRAPGIPIGVQMVLLARDKLGKAKLGAVVETQVCLSDAIQFLTGCTIGNKYLILLDKIGKYALTLYDRKDGRGIRVWVDLEKIDPEKMPETRKFFTRTRDPIVVTDMQARKESGKIIVDEFMANGRDIFSWQQIQMKNYAKPSIAAAKICKQCKESFLVQAQDDELCLVCRKVHDYYEAV